MLIHRLLASRSALPSFLAWILPGIVMLLLLTVLLAGRSAHTYAAIIPNQTDWLECGPIFSAGNEGDWDYILWGGFASTLVKKDGVFYLYYQGADGYDDDEGTVTWRSIGLATSSDGVHFSKYAANPVLTWFPKNNLEEGAVSAGAFLDATGEIALYYGANTWAGGRSVNADGRLAVSYDGFHLSDEGIVLDHKDSSIWGAGDELFPIIGFHDAGRWFTYYIPNGTPQKGRLGVAWGDRRDHLDNSAAARSGLATLPVWGPGSFARLAHDTYALFLNDVYRPGGPIIEARIVALDAPDQLSAPVQSYRFEDVWEAVVFLDEDSNTWFMYYRSADHAYYGVKLAAADDREMTCPVQQPVYLPLIEKATPNDTQNVPGLVKAQCWD
jgi:hypothetical protein